VDKFFVKVATAAEENSKIGSEALAAALKSWTLELEKEPTLRFS